MRPLKLVVILAIIAFGTTAYGQGFRGDGVKSTVRGTAHDMTRDRRSGPNFVGATALCEFCHVPHKYAAVSPTNPPLLWNITVKTNNFQLYQSSSFKGADIRQPSLASPTNAAAYYTLLCLSCHDGASGTSTMYKTTSTMIDPATGLPATGNLNARSNGITVAAGLADDHPVDFTYGAALVAADSGIQMPDGSGPVASVGPNFLPLFKDAPGDSAGRVECATCHNPHNDTIEMFLRMDNERSAMCLNCHL